MTAVPEPILHWAVDMAGRGSHLIVDEVFGLLETKTTRELSKEEEGDLAGLPNNVGGAHATHDRRAPWAPAGATEKFVH